ncbi:MAG: hypothetical protein JWO80_3044 [Bryobacterales bacterium]|nr:hypothetical protein [Bryobacterales bacterium]
MYATTCSLFILISAAVFGSAAPNQFTARYLPIGTQSQALALASDSSGNLFTVSTVLAVSGRNQIRVIKTDAQGNSLASLDFGGTSSHLPDVPSGAVVDPQGNLVIVGTTTSSDFPLVSPLFSKTTTQAGFIVKLDSQLKQIVFSTRLGGTQGGVPNQGGTSAKAVAVDSTGNIYVVGTTAATDFPITVGAFQSKPPSGDLIGSPAYAYVTEISSAGGRLIYSTYFGADSTNCLGGSRCIGAYGGTIATGIAIDSSGAVTIAGNTTANHLAVTPGTFGQQCQCSNTIQVGFIAKLAAGGSQLIWATYVPLAQVGLPFQSDISINAVVLDSSGNVIIGGIAPDGFPFTKGALQTVYPGGNSAPSRFYAGFVSKVDASGQRYMFSTYLGGNVASYVTANGVTALAVDTQGNIWATGGSVQSELPFPSSIPALGQTYLAGLSSDGSTIVSGVSAPVGAAGQSVAVTAKGNVVALGNAGSLLISSTGQGASLVGIANSAGSRVSGEVAPYELVSFFGIGIGPATAISGQVVNGVLMSSAGGIQVLFDGVPGPILYAGPNQINAIVPGGLNARSSAAVQIVSAAATITGPVLSIVASRPEVFQNYPPASGAVALNQESSINSAANPAGRGSIVTIWATGTGVFNRAEADGSITGPVLSTPVLPVSVISIANQGGSAVGSLEVLYSGDAPEMVAGVLQVNFRIPSQLQAVPNQIACQLQVGGALSGTFTIYIKP